MKKKDKVKKEDKLAAYRAKPPVTKEVADLCFEVYLDEIDRDGLNAIRNGLTPRQCMFEQYRKKYGSKDKAEEVIRDNALICRIIVEAVQKVLKDWKAKPPKFLKSMEPSPKGAEFNPKFVFELCVQIYKDELDRWNMPSPDGTKASERQLARVIKRKGSKEAGLKRFRDYAQIYAPSARSVLRVLQAKGKLPKGATS